MRNIPYNCIKDNKGYIIPKSAAIKNCPEIVEWLSTFNGVRFMFNDRPNTLKSEGEWLVIGIGHSHVGNIYCNASTNSTEFFENYYANNSSVKNFNEDYEAFRKYMTWVGKLGPWFTKQNFK